MRPLAALYARGASWRRHWYARHPDARRALSRPVISVGNLAVGGSGKTPVVAALARWLHSDGERPAVLTRGYARRQPADGVVVVSDGAGVLEPVARSGDEPQWLARALPGVAVIAGADRHLAGCIAERRLGCTVHVLDDGFQHFTLRRDLDLLSISRSDLDDDVLPAGRLREPLTAADTADALLVGGAAGDAAAVAARWADKPVFEIAAAFAEPRLIAPFGQPLAGSRDRRAVAVAGIARPQRFFDTLRALGWDVAEEIVFRDHHWFGAGDLARVSAAAARAGADVVLTTEKDAMRLLDLPPAAMPHGWAYLPMRVSVEPWDRFAAFVRERLARARDSRR